MESEEPIRSLHELLEKTYPLECSSSTYEYLDGLDENADSRDTMIEVVTWLYHEFHICDSRDHLIVAGDAKTYQHLQHEERIEERIWGTALMVNTFPRRFTYTDELSASLRYTLMWD